MKTIEERFNLAELKIKQESFTENKGRANEVDYYIFDYLPEDEPAVRAWVKYLVQKSKTNNDEHKIISFDLYDIIIEILKGKGYLEKCFDMEAKKGFEKVSSAVANLMRVNATDGLIIEYIKERITDNSIVFITGIGKCYPILRAHTILNNMHQVIDNVPVVMMYPGKYNGQELVLFGEIKDDNYYRAFKLVE